MCYHTAGELLPHPFILTIAGGLLSVALALESPPPGVTRHHALWSSDFPQPDYSGCDYLIY